MYLERHGNRAVGHEFDINEANILQRRNEYNSIISCKQQPNVLMRSKNIRHSYVYYWDVCKKIGNYTPDNVTEGKRNFHVPQRRWMNFQINEKLVWPMQL